MNADKNTNNFSVIPDFLAHNVKAYSDRPAYRQFFASSKTWESLTWKDFDERVKQWRRGLVGSGLQQGDHVAILMPNSFNSALADMSVLCSGMTPVPLHAVDTPASSGFILNNSESKLLIVPKALRWNAMLAAVSDYPNLKLVVTTGNDASEADQNSPVPVIGIDEWLEKYKNVELSDVKIDKDDLAAIVYTSGTTGKPKGVMLTHDNIVSNVLDCQNVFAFNCEDVFLSFLPFSHTFERTVTYYLAMQAGSEVAFARSVAKLAEDLLIVRPTVFISVPRVFEQFYSKIVAKFAQKGAFVKALLDQTEAIGWRKFCRANNLAVPSSSFTWLDNILWPSLNKKIASAVREAFGGRLRISVSGGAALNNALGHFFCSMGIPLLQGYGLTETSPVVCFNIPGRNNPVTVGIPLVRVQARLGEFDELQIKGPSVMKGYWKRPEATAEAFTEDGWFKTGDQADFSDAGRIRIKGRIKEIIVTSTGEKIPPNDLELAIQADPLFEQVMVYGEGRPFITALAVVNPEEWEKFAKSLEVDPIDPESLNRRDVRLAAIRRLKKAASHFPQYGVPRNIHLLKEPWTIDNGALTVTMKLKRNVICERYSEEIKELYETPQSKVGT